MYQRTLTLFGLAAAICSCMLVAGSVASEMKNGSNAFIDAGCFAEDYNLNCDSLELEERFGCMQIINASQELDNLSPRLPIVECLYLGEDFGPSQGILREGCMMPLFRKYIVRQGEEIKLIESAEDFRSEFAPVETKEEALAFAIALTSSLSRYDTSVPEDYFSVSPTITPTYASETAGGFVVHLFDSQLCGCGTHPYYAIDYLVSRDGNVTEMSRQEVFNSTRLVCFD
ncbi:MAG: hypothetical protein A4E49_02490 [Methanosaeta sp. PtaU1.Bin112]|nr:MAG: hypothetical protein A4E49_02490 [Methanosaeta sp. PtaU1.Bin112]